MDNSFMSMPHYQKCVSLTSAMKNMSTETTRMPTSQRERHIPTKYARMKAKVQMIQGSRSQRRPLKEPYIRRTLHTAYTTCKGEG